LDLLILELLELSGVPVVEALRPASVALLAEGAVVDGIGEVVEALGNVEVVPGRLGVPGWPAAEGAPVAAGAPGVVGAADGTWAAAAPPRTRPALRRAQAKSLC
jgi:hypothetical protein